MYSHRQLVNIGEKWLIKRCGFVFKELSTFSYETPDVIGFKAGGSILIECKASRNDFLNDRKKKFRLNPSMGVGLFRYYLCPTDLIKENELPDKWGLLYVNDRKQVRQKVGPKGNIWHRNYDWMFSDRNIENEISLMYSALRRLHLQGVIPLIYEKYRKYDNHYKIYY